MHFSLYLLHTEWKHKNEKASQNISLTQIFQQNGNIHSAADSAKVNAYCIEATVYGKSRQCGKHASNTAKLLHTSRRAPAQNAASTSRLSLGRQRLAFHNRESFPESSKRAERGKATAFLVLISGGFTFRWQTRKCTAHNIMHYCARLSNFVIMLCSGEI